VKLEKLHTEESATTDNENSEVYNDKIPNKYMTTEGNEDKQ
jgi:hypothetical protein